MIPDEQFRRTFDLLAERVLADVATQLKKVGDELGGAYLAGRDKAVADASITARTEAERMIAERIAATEQAAQESVAAAEARAKEAEAKGQEMSAAADAHAKELIAAVETRTREAVAAAEAKAREDIAAAETRAHDAVNRAESLVQEAMSSAESRTRDSVAAAETQARHLVSAAEARALDAVAAVEARAKHDFETGVARIRAESASDALTSSERLVSAIRTIDVGQSLSDIMSTLLRCACLEAPRVGIFVRDGEGLRSWKLIGFGDSADRDGVPLAIADAGIIGAALHSGQTVISGPNSTEFAPTFAELPPDRTALAFPLVISREVIGVLYADPGSGNTDDRHTWAATVEVLGRHAARALEVLTASKLLAQTMTGRPAAPPQPPSPPASAPRSTLGLR